jgi:hypothetical protein
MPLVLRTSDGAYPDVHPGGVKAGGGGREQKKESGRYVGFRTSPQFQILAHEKPID